MINRTVTLAMLALCVPAATGAAQELPGHDGFTEVLRAYVHDGLVDYAALQESREGLDAYVAELAGTDAQVLGASSRDAQLAFWINAYNACALRLS